MVMVRVTYKVTFETLSELHVGSGSSENHAADREGDASGEMALVVIDTHEKPWIPGSTLKGAFRANSDGWGERLFGQAHAKGADFARGDLTFFGLSLNSSVSPVPKVRTAVDPGTGASAARKLFAQEYVPIGSRFTGEIILDCLEDRLKESQSAVLRSLNRFSRAEGISIGAGKADGLGRIRLTNVEAFVKKLGATGWSTATKETVTCKPDMDEDWTSIELDCPGPYLVFGKKDDVLDSDGEEREITFPERTGKLPRLFPTGVAGALRARALWLAECAALQRGELLEATAITVKTSAGDLERTVVQRLCGDEGYRASMAMKVELLAEAGKTPVETSHPAGPLDPLLQAPRDGGLHRRKADSGVRIRLSLRMWRKEAAQDEHDLFTALTEDIRINGLALGLGTVKGFGWFGITPTAPTKGTPARGLTTVLPKDKENSLPDRTITLPYRQVEVAPETVGMPELVVQAAHKARNLHAKPLPDGLSGWVDVSWCFETPMLVGDTQPTTQPVKLSNGEMTPKGAVLRNPQMINKLAVIPGTTLRGTIRNLIETVTSARIGPHRMNEYDFPEPRKPNDRREDFPLRAIAEKFQTSRAHNPGFTRDFTPDFAQALLGFISPDTGDLDPEEHAALHLKSRISFGWASARSGLDAEASQKVHRVLLASPDPTSVFMDHVGRRVYPVTSDSLQTVARRIEHQPSGKNDKMPSYLRFLHPKADQPLVFRGRIKFQNVTEVELGALMWAITLGMSPGSRHMIGMARALGAGRCYAADLKMEVKRNDGTSVTRSDTTLSAQFGPDGGLAQTYVTAFNNWLTKNGLRNHGFQERLVAANPAFGDAMERACGGFAYQTNQILRSLPKKRDSIARSNGGAGGKGRLAAVLRR